MRTTLTTLTTTATSTNTLTSRIRIGAVRVVGVTVLAAGAITAVGGPFVAEAGALPKPPGIDIDDLTDVTVPPETIPPTVPTTVKPPFFPPVDLGDLGDITVETIPPETIPPTTVPPADDPTDEATPTTTAPPADDPDDLTTETVPPTTVAPTDPTDPTDPAGPADVEDASAERPADQLAYTGDSPMFWIVGGSLLAAGTILAGGAAYDRRRKAQV